MTDIEIKNTNKILSLSEASKVTGYHQDYLGFLCRTGKLEGHKIGRNWTTTSAAIKKLMNSGVVDESHGTTRSTPTSIPVRVEKTALTFQEQTIPVNTVVGLPITLRAISKASSSDQFKISKIHSEVLQTTINGLEQKVSQLNVRVDSFDLTKNEPVFKSEVTEQARPQNFKPLQANFISNLGSQNIESSGQQLQSDNLDVSKIETIYESFKSRQPQNLKVYVVSLAAVLFFLSGTMALAGSGLFKNFFGTSPKIIVTNYNSTPKIAGATDEQNKSTSSGNSGGTVLNSYVTNYQVPVSLDEDYLNRLIYDNLVNAKESGLFGDVTPLQAVPNNNSFNPPIGLPTSYAPISYYQPPQPSSQGGGSIFAATQLSSKTFTTNTATVTESLTVTGPSSINGNLTVTGNITSSSGTLNPGLTAGSVVFQGASGLAQDNNSFFWDDSRDSLGIGTATVPALLSLAGSSDVGTGNITSSSGTSVTGTGTAFTTQLKVGDVIVVNGQPRTIATIISDTSLTTTTAFNPALTTTPSVSYVNTATTNTGTTEANTLTWNHYVDSTVENRLLVVAVATHKNASLVIPDTSTVTYGGQAMTRLGLHGTSTNTGINFFYLVAPSAGTNQVVVTLSSSATARIVGQSILFANVNQSSVFGSSQSGGGTSNLLGGAGFGSTTRQALITVGSIEANITADIDEDGTVTGAAPSTELGNLSTGSTSSDPRLVTSFAHLLNNPPFYITFTAFVLSGSTSFVYKSPTVNNAATATGAFVYRSSFLSVKDSVSYEQIKIAGDGQANFHNGISVDLLGSYGYNNYAALFNGGFVGIGTTTPANELSVTGDANFSGTLGVAGGAVDPNIGINIESSGAYGGSGVVRYGFSAGLTATDLSNVKGGYFSANSTYGSVGADHNIMVGVGARASFSGAGRLDNAIGIDISVSNNLTGNMHDSYGAYAQISNLGQVGEGIYNGGQVDTARVYFADIVNASNTNAITSASAFQGQIRTLSGAVGTAGYGTVYGLNLSGWNTFGLPVTTSYGIYMDNSIDIGTTKYALWSQSASQSYLQGSLGIGDATPSAKLEVGDGTDSLQVSSVGDLLFVDADGGSSITGPAGGALTVASGTSQDIILNSADTIELQDNTNVTGFATVSGVLQGGGTTALGYSRLGTNTTGHALDAANDLLITDDLEVDGDAFFDGNLTVSGTCNGCGGMSIGATITSATQGSILFAGASGVLAQDNTNFFWDGTNNNLKLGNPAEVSTAKLNVKVTTGNSYNLFLEGTGGVAIPTIGFKLPGFAGVAMTGSSGGFGFNNIGEGTTISLVPGYPDAYIQTHTSSAGKLHIQSHNGSAFVETITVSDGLTGIATASPAAGMELDVAGQIQLDLAGTQTSVALCGSHTAASGASVSDVEIVDCTGTPAADYMEYYSVEANAEMGDVVTTSDQYVFTKDEDRLTKLVKSNKAYQTNIIGVVSDKTKAGDFNSIGYNIKDEDNPLPIALNGRVKVKVTNENGVIRPGDYLTSSKDFPGYAMRATEAGLVIGKALEGFDGGSQMIMMFVDVHEYTPTLSELLQGNNTNYQDLVDLNLTDAKVYGKLIVTDTLYVATLIVKDLKADRVETKQLCIEDLCINKDQFNALLEQWQNSGSSNPSSGGNSQDQSDPSPDVIIPDEPVPDPVPVVEPNPEPVPDSSPPADGV